MKTHLLIFVFCFIVSQAFAAPDVLNDNTIAEKDTFLVEKKELTQNNKTESFHLCYLLSVGFNFDSSISESVYSFVRPDLSLARASRKILVNVLLMLFILFPC